VRAVLEMPDEVRQSQTDSSVFLFYKLERKGRWVCVPAFFLRPRDPSFL
jgi:hypothetical protein